MEEIGTLLHETCVASPFRGSTQQSLKECGER